MHFVYCTIKFPSVIHAMHYTHTNVKNVIIYVVDDHILGEVI